MHSHNHSCITDSTATFFALLSGRTSTRHPVFMRLRRRIWRVVNEFSLKVAVALVPSEWNAADAPSRLHQFPLPLVLLRSACIHALTHLSTVLCHPSHMAAHLGLTVAPSLFFPPVVVRFPCRLCGEVFAFLGGVGKQKFSKKTVYLDYNIISALIFHLHSLYIILTLSFTFIAFYTK